MNRITKYNLKTLSISVAGLILLFCGLSYMIAPQSESLDINSVNPLGILEGIVFALGFGLGFPLWLSLIVIALVSILLLLVFLWVVRKMLR